MFFTFASVHTKTTTTTTQGSLASFVRTYTLGIANRNIAMRLRKRLFSVSIRKKRNDQNAVASVSMLSAQTDQIATVATNTCANLLRGLSSVVGGTFMLLRISPQLTAAAVSIVPLIGATAMIQNLGKKTRAGELQRRVDETNTWAEERLHHVKTVRVFHRESFEEKSYENLVRSVRDVAVQNARADGIFMASLNLTLTSSLGALVLFGGYLSRKGKVTAGQLTAFGMHTLWLGLGTASLISIRRKLVEAAGASEQVLSLVRENSRRKSDDKFSLTKTTMSKKKVAVNCTGDIIFDNVHFRYPSRPDHGVLRGFNLRVRGGSRVVLVGASGSGKSTVVDLLSLVVTPQKGSIRVNGVEISEIQDYRDRIGVVSQRPVLWNKSIRANIRYGNLSSSDEDINRAARSAGILQFVNSLRDGMDTIVGEEGQSLSGGQLARVAIARALVKNPSILVLDEAFSSLDVRTKSQVLDEVMSSSKSANRTVIFITHDTSILTSAESIIVLENGVKVEQGTYRRLSSAHESSGALERAMMLWGDDDDDDDDDDNDDNFDDNTSSSK